MLDLEKSYSNQIFTSATDANAYEICGAIDKIHVAHTDLLKALDGILNCIKASVYAREPMGCMLLGDGGMGKTMLAEFIMRRFQPTTLIHNNCEIDTAPAFYISFKNSENLGDLTGAFLEKLNDRKPRIGKTADRAARVRELLHQCKTVILFLDELHDLQGLQKHNRKRVTEFIGWVKELSNTRSFVICLMGEPSCKNIFDSDTQMARRFKRQYTLNALTPGTAEQCGALTQFLEQVGLQLLECTPLQSLPPIHVYENALRFFAAAGGNLDFTMTLIKDAVLTALLNGRTSLVMEDFAQSWDKGITHAASKIRMNPFSISNAELANALRGKYR